MSAPWEDFATTAPWEDFKAVGSTKWNALEAGLDAGVKVGQWGQFAANMATMGANLDQVPEAPNAFQRLKQQPFLGPLVGYSPMAQMTGKVFGPALDKVGQVGVDMVNYFGDVLRKGTAPVASPELTPETFVGPPQQTITQPDVGVLKLIDEALLAETYKKLRQNPSLLNTALETGLGAVEETARTAEGLTSPKMLLQSALLPLKVGPIKPVPVAFGGSIAEALPEMVDRLASAKTPQEVGGGAAGLALGGLMSRGALKHGLADMPEAPLPKGPGIIPTLTDVKRAVEGSTQFMPTEGRNIDKSLLIGPKQPKPLKPLEQPLRREEPLVQEASAVGPTPERLANEGGQISFRGGEPLPTARQAQIPLEQLFSEQLAARLAEEERAKQPAALDDLLSLRETLTKQQIVPTKKSTPVKSAYEAAQQWAQDTIKRRGGVQSVDPEILAAHIVKAGAGLVRQAGKLGRDGWLRATDPSIRGSVFVGDDGILLNNVENPQAGTGAGTKFIQGVMRLADETKLPLRLVPEALDPTKQEGLEGFYEKLGFTKGQEGEFLYEPGKKAVQYNDQGQALNRTTGKYTIASKDKPAKFVSDKGEIAIVTKTPAPGVYDKDQHQITGNWRVSYFKDGEVVIGHSEHKSWVDAMAEVGNVGTMSSLSNRKWTETAWKETTLEKGGEPNARTEVQGTKEEVALQKEAPRGVLPEGVVGPPVGPTPMQEFYSKEGQQRAGLTLQAGEVLLDPKKIGFGDVTKPVDAVQLVNRLRNKLGEKSTEWTLLKEAGIEEQVKGQKSPQELARWAQENGPRVEVRKLETVRKVSDVKREFDRMTHEWRDNLPRRKAEELLYSRDANDLRNVYHWNETDIAKGVQYKALEVKVGEEIMARTGEEEPLAHWSSIAPKPEGEMKGYVEIAVVKRRKGGDLDVESLKVGGDGEKFPSSHSFPPNTLAFVRGYMEGDTFHIVEVQRDIIVNNHDGTYQVSGHPEFGSKLSRADAEKYAKQVEPLTAVGYERLALKAAIEHAKEQGAKRVAVSDAETAMLTEMHDQAAVGRQEGSGGARAIEADIEQSKGMRFHYDTTLPRILEELTGEKGERVSFGEHKNAFEANPYSETRGLFGAPNPPGEKLSPRKDLIFRNPDGTPKTDVSARSYSLEKVKEVTAKQPFTLTGKDNLVQRLEALIVKQEGGLLFSLPDPRVVAGIATSVWNTGIRTALDGLNAGKEVKRLVDETLDYWKKNASYSFDEATARRRLESALMPPTKKETPAAKAAPKVETDDKPPTTAKEIKVQLEQSGNIWQRLMKRHFGSDVPKRVFESEKPTTQTALDMFAKTIRDAGPARKKTTELQKEARKRNEAVMKEFFGRFPELSELKDLNRAVAGELGRVDLEPLGEKLSAGEVRNLFHHLIGHKEVGGYGHKAISLGNAFRDLIEDGRLPIPSHIEAFERIFGPQVAKELVRKASRNTGAWHMFAEVSGALKSMKTGFDLSAPLRQGYFLTMAHPKVALKAFEMSLKAFGNREFTMELERSWRNDPYTQIMKDAGLSLPESEGLTASRTLQNTEEGYRSHFVQRLQDVKGLTKRGKAILALPKAYAMALGGSERGFVTYMNWLRREVFKQVDSDLMKKITDKDELARARHELALLINASGGRGNIRGSEIVNALIFSQKYAVSRYELPYRLGKSMLTERNAVGKEAARQTFATVASWAGLLGLVALGNELFNWGLDFNVDTPTASDLLKVQFPDGTTIDFGGGLSASWRPLAQMSKGYATSPRTDSKRKLQYQMALGQLLEGKASPLAGTIWNSVQGKSGSGGPITPLSLASDLASPITLENLVDILKAHDAAGLPLMVPEILGAGVQTPFQPGQRK